MDSIPLNNAIFISGLGKIFNNDSSLLYSEYLSFIISKSKNNSGSQKLIMSLKIVAQT